MLRRSRVPESRSTAAPTSPFPEWLVGWWKVPWRGQTYYYYFDRDRQAKYTLTMPSNTSQPPLRADDTGSVTLEPNNSVTIRWGATGSVEKFSSVPGSNEQMRGTWNATEQLTADKM